ncbi:MAG TPA: DUF72 domain-containing protein [Gemmatimonadales bacterium]|nr:DUF72 domain-containing protein [Gemmatimonadales bacterium]
MRILAGTSGWSFKEWKGSFYPKGLPDDQMLGYYASRFPTVEVNNTFYRMPKEKTMLEWAEAVPPSFRFAIKASQRITHKARLVDVGSDVEYFTRICTALGERRGPSLFQLPPNLKKDLPRLEAFLATLPRRWQTTIEFRHASWWDDAVYAALKAHDVAMCISEQDDLDTPVIPTATWGYVRLHRAAYDGAALAERAAWIRDQPWEETFVYFKHDGDEAGPAAVDGFLQAAQGV